MEVTISISTQETQVQIPLLLPSFAVQSAFLCDTQKIIEAFGSNELVEQYSGGLTNILLESKSPGEAQHEEVRSKRVAPVKGSEAGSRASSILSRIGNMGGGMRNMFGSRRPTTSSSSRGPALKESRESEARPGCKVRARSSSRGGQPRAASYSTVRLEYDRWTPDMILEAAEELVDREAERRLASRRADMESQQQLLVPVAPSDPREEPTEGVVQDVTGPAPDLSSLLDEAEQQLGNNSRNPTPSVELPGSIK
eukprot:gb/GFBE01031023.1/.p1 GENE.gb/GFBE01031023.1/~~gb/GFBE01031023.1/.p1  ORF type:complete len:254 (+),score=34.35 gb/GFBE01031023.1/:1-762(+)